MKNHYKAKIDNKNISIIFRKNYVSKFLDSFKKDNRKIFIILDKKIDHVIKLSKKNKKFEILKIDGGEKIKNFQYFEKISNKLIRLNLDRRSVLIAIGGGTIGDLSGFIASTIMRGIEFNLIPTTLLSQVDSSIGGKNGINSNYGKNHIGTFYQPKKILIDTSLLKTLDLREIKVGYSEIIKHALISDKHFFNWLRKNYKAIYKLKPNIVEKAILKSISIKSKYVINDTKENLENKNSRAILNFGHSFGHALENFYKYTNKLNHGEAISIGMVVEANISYKLGYLSYKNYNNIINHFEEANLKTFDKNIFNEKIYKALQKDKKNYNNTINLILLKNIGESIFKKNLRLEHIKKLLK